MRVAITGGTGFVGRHLADVLVAEGHEVVLVARGNRIPNYVDRQRSTTRLVKASVTDVASLHEAFAGCDAVAHCAGINREVGAQTYATVHITGTTNVVAAARDAGVRKIVMLSFLRARPNCGSQYHESKWAAEELVRRSGLDFTVVKASMTFGLGDHMLDHLSHWLYLVPLFITVGMREQMLRPVAVQDVVDVMAASLVGGRLSRQTVAVMGPEALPLSEVVRRVGRLIGKRPLILPAPAVASYGVAQIAEWLMRVPLASLAQVRILEEGLVEAWGPVHPLPDDLAPRTPLSDTVLRAGLPAPGRFTFADLRIHGG